MDWTLDTGTLGAKGIAPADLRKHLEADREHLRKTSTASAGAAVFLAAHKEDLSDSSKLGPLQERAQAAKESHGRRFAMQDALMSSAIDAACKLAEGFGGENVCCTIKGHVHANHPSGVHTRVSVYVDAAPHDVDDDEDY